MSTKGASRAAFVAEQQRRQEAEARLVRLQENNQALARSNGRLQEQLARLRGEADLRQHEDGCARAAAAVRAREAAACIARLQTALQRAAADRAALMQQLEGKQQVIAYLEGKLAQQQGGAWCTAAPAEEGRSRGLQGASGRAAQQSALSSAASDGSRLRLGYAAAEAVSEQLQEEEEAHATGAEQEASSGSTPARPQGKEGPALLPDAAGGSRMAPASSSGAAASGEDPAAAPAGDPPSPPPGTAVQAPQTEATPQQQVLAPHSVSREPTSTILRTSLRPRNSVSYALPSLSRKLRQGDPFTFGSADAAAAGAGAGNGRRGRARTKPRPRFSGATAAGDSGNEGGEMLPTVADS